ncbi:MAG: 6,7-dimethyl-8-ribityllumazine synthase [Candidatus Hydrogenedentes bacterium]|nr:6,7-dimethyl-8-ribityllumazine synthase [Candidatus Hydrogenedentota bacterium]
MPKIVQGDHNGQGKKFGIVVSKFYESISGNLLDGALGMLAEHGVADDAITIAWTPGTFEIPLVAKKMAESDGYDAVITLGCVIRGETAHFDYVAGEAAKGIGQVSMESGCPVLFGVLTTETREQAIARSGPNSGNKGADVAMAALEMANLMGQL